MSEKFKIDKIGLLKVGKGALIAGAGTALVYLTENIGTINFGDYTALAVGISCVVVNFLRKLLIKYE